MKQVMLLLCSYLLLCSCNNSKENTQDAAENLKQTSREWAQAAEAGDIEKTLSYWADDAVIISGGQPMIEGKAAIRNMVEESFKMPGFEISWEPQSATVSEDGKLGYLVEDSHMVMPDSTGQPVKHHFKSVTIWKKQADGTWKNVVDVMSPLPQ